MNKLMSSILLTVQVNENTDIRKIGWIRSAKRHVQKEKNTLVKQIAGVRIRHCAVNL